MIRALCTVVLLSAAALAIDDVVLDQVSRDAGEILRKSQTGGVVRQCACGEQRECVIEMKAQAKACAQPCFARFNKITDKTENLKQCFDNKNDILNSFLDCFESRVEGCLPHHDPSHTIPRTDIAALFHHGEQKLSRPVSNTLQAIIAPIKEIIDTAGEFAKCVKDCFIEKNRGGFCFDRKGCQPLILEDKAQNGFRSCMRKMHWKKQAADMCECAVHAGLTDLKQYCVMFRLMGRRGNKHPTSPAH